MDKEVRVAVMADGEQLKVTDLQSGPVSVEASIAVPVWLLAGVALGTLASVAAAGIFAVGVKLFPPVERPGGPHVSSDGRRRQEIRAFLRATDERFVEEYALENATVDFYLPERNVAITFDAQAYFQLDATDTFVVLCEHEMPGANLGRRLPFDVEVQGSSASRTRFDHTGTGPIIGNPTTDPVDAAFATLGVSRDADVETVQSAYREQVKDVHPDQGGDEEAFKALREAYTTAKNHARD